MQPTKKVLIIEDDVFLGDVLVEKLKNAGYEPVLARDGKEGYDKIKEIKPDLILLDIILPSMNGYEILEAKAKDAEIAAVPVIVISNSGQPVEINRVLALGVKDYLIKAQFDPGEVLEKVSKELNLSETPAMASKDLNGKKIMWVEDDKFLSDLISRKLSTQGSVLVHAASGEEAIQKVEKEMPDILLLDVLLPGMSGFDVLQKVKENPATKHIPVLMLSNMGQRSDFEKSDKLGAKKFLVKATVTLDEIVQEIKNLI